ncbi:MAG: iojap-like ribosome-associated protein [Candidatus Atelocyanobacterium thalassa isolate SIO64986]|uniref:Ribosomal silencing factor RsfS n=1 Tax=Candidatus Atelocyanobacterium thalassa isolate SIO64986 TaxID=1527444 RepID=A0A086CHD5_9CHRO|nr:MAG: iojap-like ribosome-associated protein [Candidatus Atelocyanobacterium thalassa isolate SIO64986]
MIEDTKSYLNQELAKTVALAASDRKASDILILEVTEICYLADYFVIVTGFSTTQLKAIAQTIEEKVYQEYSQAPRHSEGEKNSNWILQDFGDVITHIFLPEEREFYNLEAFWNNAKKLELSSLGIIEP